MHGWWIRGASAAKTLANRRPVLGLALLSFALALAARLPDLGASCNVDAVLYWFGRTRKFWAAVDEGRFDETYFSPHPGVSIMWFSGAGLRVSGLLERAVSEASLVAATAPLAVLASLVPAATVPLLYRALTVLPRGAAAEAAPSRAKLPVSRDALLVAALTAALLATEPFLIAHARTFQLDATATGFTWLGVLFGVLTLLERRFAWAVAAGGCFAVAILTRMLMGTFLVGLSLAFAVAFALERPRTRRLPLLWVVMGVSASLVVYLSWPALLVDPVGTARLILRHTAGTVERGHREFSWGQIYSHDPGPGFYGGVLLMRLTPEVLGLALLALFLAWRWPKRTLVVLAILASSYLPPAIGLLASAKKADRYALLFFPLATFVAMATLVDLARRIPLGRLGARSAWVGGGAIALLLGLRALRVAAIHPVPIAWCASYPGLRCEDVITLGQGEGFREAALWIDAHSPVRTPSVLSAYAGGAVLSPWLRFRRVKDGADAHFVVTYLASDQRDSDTNVRRYAVGKPAYEVVLQDRVYARVYYGPKYAKQRRRR